MGAGARLGDAGRQLRAALDHFRDGEALDLVQNSADTGGLEAWRVLTRRFNPWGAGRRRNVTLQPVSFDPKELNSAIATWEEKVEEIRDAVTR